jgi:hypothetical protein
MRKTKKGERRGKNGINLAPDQTDAGHISHQVYYGLWQGAGVPGMSSSVKINANFFIRLIIKSPLSADLLIFSAALRGL